MLLTVLLLAGALLPALAALPSPGQVGSPAQAGSPVPLMWTPEAEITVGAPAPVDAIDSSLLGRDSFGSFYILKAPCDGIIDYLYSWTGFFAVGETLMRFYDAKLIDDLAKARALAGKFNAQPYIIAGLAARGVPAMPGALPLVPGFPSPMTTPVAPATVLPSLRPGRAAAASAARAGSAAPSPAPPAATRGSSRAQLTPALRELATAQQKLATTDQELAARRQLEQSGVLAPEEVVRCQAQRDAAAAAVSAAQHKVQQSEAAGSHPAATTRASASAPSAAASAPTGPPLPVPTPAPMALPAVPAIPPPPAELQELSMPRWQDLFAPTGGLVFRPMVPPGTMVKKGTPILKVINSAWAHLRLVVPAEQALRFDRALPVTVNYPEVPGLRFVGQVTGKSYAPGDNRVVVDLEVTWPESPYQTQSVLLAMACASAPAREARELELAVKPPDRATTVAGNPLFSLLPTLMVASQVQAAAHDQDGPLVGRVALVPPVPQFGPAVGSDPQAQSTLDLLHDWQTSFVDGMTTAIYNQKLLLSYPRTGQMSQVVEKMMKGEVEHDPGYCARTLRLALGWGLGDAYNWAVELPKRGWAARADGLPRPGDILVWPFTYGRNHSQHIGVAVRQNGSMMLLSNLEGRLGTSPILGGYISFYQLPPLAGPAAVPLPVATGKR